MKRIIIIFVFCITCTITAQSKEAIFVGHLVNYWGMGSFWSYPMYLGKLYLYDDYTFNVAGAPDEAFSKRRIGRWLDNAMSEGIWENPANTLATRVEDFDPRRICRKEDPCFKAMLVKALVFHLTTVGAIRQLDYEFGEKIFNLPKREALLVEMKGYGYDDEEIIKATIMLPEERIVYLRGEFRSLFKNPFFVREGPALTEAQQDMWDQGFLSFLLLAAADGFIAARPHNVKLYEEIKARTEAKGIEWDGVLTKIKSANSVKRPECQGVKGTE